MTVSVCTLSVFAFVDVELVKFSAFSGSCVKRGFNDRGAVEEFGGGCRVWERDGYMFFEFGCSIDDGRRY